MPGYCNQNGAIYEATVATDDDVVESYVGLAKNCKKRFIKHKATLASRSPDVPPFLGMSGKQKMKE